jgi:hypothetical protein
VILSTAHKAKGREWDSVRLASDFASARLAQNPDAPSEVRLFYVAMTRARTTLVVEPSLLALFCTDAWKTKESQPRRPFRRPQTPSASRHNPPRPRPHRPSSRRPEIREAETVACSSSGSPSAVRQAPVQPVARRTQIASLAPASRSRTRRMRRLWKRIATLFN